MFDIGWTEMAIILVIALLVIGPRDLPKVLRTMGRYAGKVRAMAREFQDSIDEAVREAELDEVKKQIEQAGRTDVKKAITDTVDPGGEIGKAFDTNAPDKAAEAAPEKAPGKDEAPAAAQPKAPVTFSQAAGAAKTANGSGEPAAATPAAPSGPEAPGAQTEGRAPDKAGA